MSELQDSPIGFVPSYWHLVHLSEIAVKIGSGATPRGGKEVYLDERINFALVRSQNVFDRYFDDSGLVYITDEDANKLKNAWLQEGDVLLNITGDGMILPRFSGD